MTSAVIWRDRENYRGAGGDFFFLNSKLSGSHMPSPEERYIAREP